MSAPHKSLSQMCLRVLLSWMAVPCGVLEICSSRRTYCFYIHSSTLMVTSVNSNIFVSTSQTTERHIPENYICHSHCHENPKSLVV